ncbi:AMP-binding protein [Pukyongiella litopenaei]|uniref:Long-chain-fatty-acid--CoA ligase n=1 Tax=Pukyongiella litopenaei TaxID=2605946 RepID=A0A2S0MNI5_9RHOB|nr:AMP-binding protein [Pukyongiella litopenaei]AVO37273.1 AMP-binding protein [Pukyongiella litopenaei]
MERIWQKNYGTIPAEIETSGTVVDLLAGAVGTWGDKPAFHCLHTDLTFAEVDRLSRDIAAWLQTETGLARGDRVAVMMPNLLAHPVISFGIIRAGGVQVNVNPLYTPRELAHQLNDAGVETIVIFNQVTPTLAAVLERTGIRTIVTTGLFDLCDLQAPNPPVHPDVAARAHPLPQVLMAGRDMVFSRPDITPDDLIFLQYTGGTTGLSKGAMLSHGNLMSNIASFEAWVADVTCPGHEVVVTALPLYHIFALTVNFLCYFKLGAHNVLIPNPRDLPSLVQEWKKWRVTAFTGVNTLYNGLVNTPGFEDCDFSGLTVAFGGGSATQRSVSDRWKQLTGLHVTEGYGLSETSPIVAANLLNAPSFTGTVGVAFPSTDIRILGEDDRDLGIGEPGEICVRGPQVMTGYWGREAERDAYFTPDGYFRTGDIATMDEDGYVRIVDRKKDMVLVSGFNVFPNEIEDVLAGMDTLLESACIGVPDDKTGEAVKVFCVKKEPTVTADDVIAFCRQQMTAYKVPRHVEFVAELPKSTVGKILRRELRSA